MKKGFEEMEIISSKPFLFSMESDDDKLPGAAESEGEPAGVAPGHVAHILSITVEPPGIGEGRNDGPAEKAELGAVGMAGQGNSRSLPESFIQERGMMGQKHHRCSLWNTAERFISHGIHFYFHSSSPGPGIIDPGYYRGTPRPL